MKIAIISLTDKGAETGGRISNGFGQNNTVKRFSFTSCQDAERYSDIRSLTSELFGSYEIIVFVCAVGIAVRMIAPHVSSKLTDPAVVAVDEQGKFAVPLLSGHIGGANAAAEKIAEYIGATPVITTATDIGRRFSPDSFAKANDLIIKDINMAKVISSAVLRGERIGVESELPLINIPEEIAPDCECAYGICISGNSSRNPFMHTLNLIPRNIIIGIGCRKGVSESVLESRIINALCFAGIEPERLCAAATIDIKSDEPAIISFCKKYDIPLRVFTSEEIMKVEGEFTSSEFVRNTVGADNVCERSAAACGGKIIMKKNAGDGVTCAAAEINKALDFERKIL
ncbi:MAG: cobalt-precorrin 5A hydrolase [Huintestinicola sp.]